MSGRPPVDAPAQLRARLAEGLVVAPFVFDALQALAAQHAGARAVYLTGFGTAASFGDPDIGLIGLPEMVANARRIASSVGVPVVADGDTGYGSVVNVRRTIEEHAAAGVAAVHIEDQRWPKRCGFFEGKEVVPVEEMVAKMRAAVDAAGADGPIVIARTDALAPHGWDEAVVRVRRYADAGAELLFVDGLRTAEDAETCAERLGDLPLVYNGGLPADRVAALGFRLQLAIGTLLASWRDQRDRMAELVGTGTVAIDDPVSLFVELTGALGLPEAESLRGQYEREVDLGGPGRLPS